MKRLIVCLFLAGELGCGQRPFDENPAEPSMPPDDQAATYAPDGITETPDAIDRPPAPSPEAVAASAVPQADSTKDPTAILEKLGGFLERNDQDEVTSVLLDECSISDAALA